MKEQRSALKGRGAFFTPPPIATFLAEWAIAGDREARVLDPTCGEAVFLIAAGQHLVSLGQSSADLDGQVFGIDIHENSLRKSDALLEHEGLDAHLQADDFFLVSTPGQLDASLPTFDAVIGNPPFVRYQLHKGDARKAAAKAALRGGVRFSGLASSWAPLIVHAAGFLKPEGRLAMVLPAELLTVHYAEPLRRWLRKRFAAVSLVIFETLQFEDALENVVLLLARGSGGCDAFSLYFVREAGDLSSIKPFEEFAVTPEKEGKWTDLLLPAHQRQLFKSVSAEFFEPLGSLGTVSLGSVTGANDFFALTEPTRLEYGLSEQQLLRISPPGTRHLKGTRFTTSDWQCLRKTGDRVWLLHPGAEDDSGALANYLQLGISAGVPQAYKCSIRDPWWRPPAAATPDLFFTYMSHRFPRLIDNSAAVTFLNSMHGVVLSCDDTQLVRSALPLLALNSVTLLGSEILGRSYGGGILKMEPREASKLPMPRLDLFEKAWRIIRPESARLDRELKAGRWTTVLARIDEVLLRDVLQLKGSDSEALHLAARSLRERRMGRRSQ